MSEFEKESYKAKLDYQQNPTFIAHISQLLTWTSACVKEIFVEMSVRLTGEEDVSDSYIFLEEEFVPIISIKRGILHHTASRFSVHRMLNVTMISTHKPFLSITRKVMPPLAGVDVTPVVWFGLSKKQDDAEAMAAQGFVPNIRKIGFIF
ncbi:unnamed protein product [Musa hybrid cultivar]